MDVKIAADGCLPCPKCGEQYLHQGNVTVYQREVEDGPARKTVAPAGGSFSTSYMAEWAPHRRDTALLEFACERCGSISTLIVFQHKGQTFIEWALEWPTPESIQGGGE